MPTIDSVEARGGRGLLYLIVEASNNNSTSMDRTFSFQVTSEDGSINISEERTITLTPYATRTIEVTYGLEDITEQKSIRACVEFV